MLLEISLTAFGLSMDAAAASFAMASKFRSWPKLLALIFLFAFFQAAMPLLGYLLGLPFGQWIEPVDHWLAFFILTALGGTMIFDRKKEHEVEAEAQSLTWKLIFTLALATSIDAFVVGIGFHALQWPLMTALLAIGSITLLTSCAGIVCGRFMKQNLDHVAEKVGGGILIFLGVKILVTHLFFT